MRLIGLNNQADIWLMPHDEKILMDHLHFNRLTEPRITTENAAGKVLGQGSISLLPNNPQIRNIFGSSPNTKTCICLTW